MIEALRNARKLPELRRRLLYTVLILVVFRLASNIRCQALTRRRCRRFLPEGPRQASSSICWICSRAAR
jgi:preprotein translocase subunit SecY